MWAMMTCDLLYTGTGRKLPRFMVGRHLCDVSCMLFIGRVTSVSLEEGKSNISGIRNGPQELFAVGLLGVFKHCCDIPRNMDRDRPD